MLKLNQLDHLPPGLLETSASELYDKLKEPTLIHLGGERQPALFLSLLLHGNETVGWDALRALLGKRLNERGELRLERSLSLFIGNVAAARAGLRRLSSQPDYNRVWPGSDLPDSPEHALMRQVVATMAERGVFASIDLHNNTGRNPHYGCVNRLDNAFLQLATLFSRTVVYFIRPRGVQSMAMAELAPSITVECGKIGNQRGLHHAMELIDACLHLSAIPDHAPAAHDIDLFHTVAQVKVPPHLSFSFDGDADICFSPNLDHLNFRELNPGTVLARIGRNDNQAPALIEVRDEQGRDVTARYLHVEDGELRLRQRLMPSMLTANAEVIRQDCLCYLMERYNDHVPAR